MPRFVLPCITSLQNQRVKDAIKLRTRKGRERQGRILIDGRREIQRAIDAGVAITEAFVCESDATSSDVEMLLGALRSTPAQLIPTTSAVFDKLAFGNRREGVVAVANRPVRTLDDIDFNPETAPLVAVLDGLEKPGNLGAILRSADGAGVSGVLVTEPGPDPYHHNSIRASLGVVFQLPVCVAPRSCIIEWIEQRQMQMAAMLVDAAKDYTQFDFTQPTAVILGSEAQGLGPVWKNVGAEGIVLPMAGVADSLNVSAAAAAVFYEARRQRRR